MNRLPSAPRALFVAGLAGALALSTLAPAAQPNKRPTDEVRGKELYTRHCEACHGAQAKGHGPATKALVHPVPDLTGKVKADDKTIRIVLRGKAAMPGYEQTFDNHDAKRVLQHMARLKAPVPGAKPESPAPEPVKGPRPAPVEEEGGEEGGEDDAQAPPSE